MRGLIEFTNYCRNDCYYCGIRCSNKKANRYRLSEEDILACCEEGDRLGFRTFVLQGGEDPYYTDDRIASMVREIKKRYPEHAVTLSIGERERESYERFFEAGADRYLLRHETANDTHYRKLHPESMSLAHRKQCLRTLKEIGYQTGCGFMVGSPGQTAAELAEDFLFIHELHPEMIGISRSTRIKTRLLRMKHRELWNRHYICSVCCVLCSRMCMLQRQQRWRPFIHGDVNLVFWQELMFLCQICLRWQCVQNILCMTERYVPGTRQPNAVIVWSGV